MDYANLIVKSEGPVLWVTMNRPDRLNAMNRAMVDELRRLFTDLYWRHEVRAVVLGGAGRAFCAGLDLKEDNDAGAFNDPGRGLTRQRRAAVTQLPDQPDPRVLLRVGLDHGSRIVFRTIVGDQELPIAERLGLH